MGSATIAALLLAAPLLEVHGNLVLVDQVYVAIADLPAGAEADAATAARVEQRIRDFLRRAGYDLARVDAEPHQGRIRVVVDEGRLARIIFRGRGTITTLQLRISLVLPQRIFNRPEFERQLGELSANLGIEHPTYELRPVEGVDDTGALIEELPLLPGRSLRLGGTHDLLVTLPRADWFSGLGLTIGAESYVIRIGARMRDLDLLLDDDRWSAEVALGTRFFRGVGIDDDTRVNFNDAALEVRYYTPAFLGVLRPFALFGADIIRRERDDLNVTEYWWNRIFTSLSLAYELTEGVEVGLGGGLEHRNLFRVEQGTLPPTGLRVRDLTELKTFAALEGELVFDPWALRRDRLHHVSIEARQYFGESFGTANARYQKVWPFGWNDLWLNAAGALRWGAFTVADEEPISGRYLRGVFGDRIFTSRLAAVQLGFRYSLSRDILKLGVFHDLAVLQESARARNRPRVRVGDAFGVSFHTLLLDFVQLDVYLAAGFVSDGESDFGLSAALRKAF